MTKRCIIASIILLLALCFTACASGSNEPLADNTATDVPATDVPATDVPATEPPATSKFEQLSASFSFNDAEYECAFLLPEGWHISDMRTEDCFPYLGNGTALNDIMYIYNGEGACVGALGGYGCTAENFGGDASLLEDNIAIYCMVSNGNDFNVGVGYNYTPVTSPEGCKNAVSCTYYSPSYLQAFPTYAAEEEVFNFAAVCELDAENVYCVMEAPH